MKTFTLLVFVFFVSIVTNACLDLKEKDGSCKACQPD